MFGKPSFRSVVAYIATMVIGLGANMAAGGTERNQLDPRGKVHIPIGIANSLDTLKTFIEAKGIFGLPVLEFYHSFYYNTFY